MALANTTLSSALTVDDNVMAVAAATSLAPGQNGEIGGESIQISKGYVIGATQVPILRGQDGTATKAHPSGSTVTIYVLPSDNPAPAPGTAVNRPPAGKALILSEITTSGAWTPQPGSADEEVTLNGTSVIAMTLTNPLQSQNGKRVCFKGNGIAAHTITYTTVGFGNVGSTADVVTFGASQIQGYVFEASGGFWINRGPIAVATANVSGPSLA